MTSDTQESRALRSPVPEIPDEIRVEFVGSGESEGGETQLDSAEFPVEGGPAVEADDSIEARIARRIREDSELRGRPTLIDDLETLFRDEDPDVDFGIMQLDERYRDIKLALAPAGTLYIYSDLYLSEETALERSALEDLMGKIADRVRRDSRHDVRLTRLEDLSEIAPDLSADNPILTHMSDDDRYADITTIAAANGVTFLFSEALITRSYANILSRAEANDPLEQIAATVREESKVYPRPTEIETFRQPVFGLEVEKLDEFIAQLLESADYSDIKQVKASNGAVFLFSTTYLSEALAQAQAEWTAVGQFENQ